MARQPRVQLVTAAQAAQTRRKLRNPRHPFSVSQQPFEIRPFFLAPVLPGETMKALNVQLTAQSGLMYNHLNGWWWEMYFFYVKHRDLAERDLLTDIHVKNVTDASLVTAADPLHYHAGGINWSKLCLRRVVEEYFRNEGETWLEYVSADGLPLASINQDDWLDSAIREGAVPVSETQGLPDELLEQDMVEDHGVPAGFEAHYDHWLTMRRNQLIATDFEDYLRANGIRVPKDEVNPHRPELIRYVRDFQQPKRAIAASGEEACLVNWKLTERADKDRLFTEPGFLFGVSVARPKVFRDVAGSAADLMTDAFAWLPALMQDNPETSLRVIPAALAATMFPNYAGTEDIIADMRDLFLYGEQYVAGEFAKNYLITDQGPDADFDRRYPSTDIGAGWWFESGASEPAETYYQPPSAFLAEGLVSLSIASRISQDTSGHGNQLNPAV